MTDHGLGWHLGPPLVAAVVNPIFSEWMKRGAKKAHCMPKSEPLKIEDRIRDIQARMGGFQRTEEDGRVSFGEPLAGDDFTTSLQSIRNQLRTPSIPQTTPAGHSIIYRLEHIETVLGETSTPLSTKLESIQNRLYDIRRCLLDENVPFTNSPSILVMLHQMERKIDQQSIVNQLESLEKAIGKNGEEIARQTLRIEKLESAFQQLSLGKYYFSRLAIDYRLTILTDLKESTDAEEAV